MKLKPLPLDEIFLEVTIYLWKLLFRKPTNNYNMRSHLSHTYVHNGFQVFVSAFHDLLKKSYKNENHNNYVLAFDSVLSTEK